MARIDQTSGSPPADSSDKAIWEYCRATDAERDEADCFLDLAGFADSRLDDDERERVAALMAGDPNAAGDVAAARALAATVAAADVAIVARALALVGAAEVPRGVVVPLSRRARPRPSLYSVASWGSLAAGIVAASWLGFALGSDASLAYGQAVQSAEDSFLGDLIDPTSGVLSSINDGLES